MRIAFVTSEFVTESSLGGQASYLGNISKILSGHGHEIVVITASDRDDSLTWNENVQVERVRYNEDISGAYNKIPIVKQLINWLWFTFGMSFVLRRRLLEIDKEERFDIVQISNLRGIATLMPKWNRCVVRLSNHQAAWRMANEEHFDRDLVNKNMLLHEKIWIKSLKKYKWIFGPSEVVAVMTSDVIGKKIDIIESPYLITEKIEVGDKRTIEGEYYLFFGTLNYIKGINTLCEAADEVLNKYKDISFVLMGPYPDTINCSGSRVLFNDYINKKVKNRDRFIILGPIYEVERKNEIIIHAKACILPSRIDNLPNTCIEAMSRGKLVIGSIGASIDQLIKDNVSGLLFSPDDIQGLIECIKKTEEMSQNEIMEMEKHAINEIKSLSPDLIYAKLMKYYERMIV